MIGIIFFLAHLYILGSISSMRITDDVQDIVMWEHF